MTTAAETQKLIKRISRLVRATRKLHGLNQKTVSEILGIDQSALSRVESGTQALTVPQWFVYCHFVGISPDSLSTGFVEMLDETRKKLSRERSLKLPPKYSHHIGARMRAMLPILNHYGQVLGESKLHRRLEEMGVDPDLLINLNEPINIDFFLDMARGLLKDTSLNTKEISQISKSASNEAMHGNLRFEYNRMINDQKKLILALISNMNQYETDFTYRVEDVNAKYIDVCETPTENLKFFNYRNDPLLGDFLAQYQRGFFANFSGYGQKNPAVVTILENHYKGAPQCLYRIQPRV